MSMSVTLAVGAVAVLSASRVAAQGPSPAPAPSPMMPSPAPAPMNATAPPPMGNMTGPPPGTAPEPSTADLAALMPPYVATADVEYTPLRAPANGPAVTDVGMGLTVATATDCAQACIRTQPCNMATWTGNDPTWDLPENCYLKVIQQPCEVPAEAEAIPNFYLLMAQVPGCGNVSGIPPNMPTEDPAGALSGGVAAAGTLPGMAPGEGPGMAPGEAPMPGSSSDRGVSVLPDGTPVPPGTPGSVPEGSPGAAPISAPTPSGSEGGVGQAQQDTGSAFAFAGGAAVALAALVAMLA